MTLEAPSAGAAEAAEGAEVNAALNHAVNARSFLFVPATRPERYAKALASGAGAVIIDLEDAVSPGEKNVARDQLATGFAALSAADRQRVVVRINASETEWHAGDLKLISQLAMLDGGLAGVVLSKAESAAQLEQLAASLDESATQGDQLAIFPLIESAAGLDALAAIAAAPGVRRLMFGNLDFQADLGMACDADEAELQPARFQMVLASRLAGLPAPVDGVTPGTGDTAQVARDAARGRRSGFGGKLCIHPSQVAAVEAAHAPTAAQIDWARRVVEGDAAAGGGVFTLDGRMVDAPVLRLARRVLASAPVTG